MRKLIRSNISRMFSNFLKTPIRESRKNFSISENTNVMAPNTKMIIPNKEASNFFEKALSVEKLMTAWAELKSNPGFVSSKELNNSLNNITLKWFKQVNKALLEGSLRYSNRQRTYIPKAKSLGLRLITISSPRVKIIKYRSIVFCSMRYSWLCQHGHSDSPYKKVI